MDTSELIDVLLKYLLVWWYSQTTGEGSSTLAKQHSSNTSSSCKPSPGRCGHQRGSIGIDTSIDASSKHTDVSASCMMGDNGPKYSLFHSLLTPTPVPYADTKLSAAPRFSFFTPNKTGSITSEADVVVPSTPSPVCKGHSSSVGRSSRQPQAAGSGFASIVSSCSTPGFMLPTASSKARSMGTVSKRSTSYLSTPAQVDRVRKATEVWTSGRLQSSGGRGTKVPARQPLQDTRSSSSGSKAQQQHIFNKLRMATEELQMRMRKLQEKRQAGGKTFVAQLAACEADKAQLKQQLAEAADQARLLRQKVAEQDGQLGAARDSLQEQLRLLEQQAKGKAEVLESQLSAAAEELAKLQGDMALQAEELRMVRMEMEGKGAQLREAEGKLQEQRQASAKEFEAHLAAATAELQDKMAQQAAQLSSQTEELRLQGQELHDVRAYRDHLNRTLAQTEREQEAEARETQRKLRGLSSKLAAIKDERAALQAKLCRANEKTRHYYEENRDLWNEQLKNRDRIHCLELRISGDVEHDYDAVKACSCWQGDTRCPACAHHQSQVAELDALEAQLADAEDGEPSDEESDSPCCSCISSQDSSSEEDSSLAGGDLGSCHSSRGSSCSSKPCLPALSLALVLPEHFAAWDPNDAGFN